MLNFTVVINVFTPRYVLFGKVEIEGLTGVIKNTSN